MDSSLKIASYDVTPSAVPHLLRMDKADGQQDNIITREGIQAYREETGSGFENTVLPNLGIDNAAKIKQVQQGSAKEIVLLDIEAEANPLPENNGWKIPNPLDFVGDLINEYIIYPAQDFIDDTLTTPITDALNPHK